MRLEGWKARRFEAWKSVCRSQLRTLLHPGGKRWWEKVDGHKMVGGSDGGRDMGASGWGGRWGVAKIACGGGTLAWEESGQRFGSLAWENEVQAPSGL